MYGFTHPPNGKSLAASAPKLRYQRSQSVILILVSISRFVAEYICHQNMPESFL